MEESTEINLRQLAVKCRSKKELYDILSTDCDVFLPPIQYANASYVRGVITGQLKHISSSQTKVIHVPMIDALKTEEIIKYAKANFELDEYLPKYQKMRLPSRPWLCTLVHTIVGQPFKEWIGARMAEREKYIVNKKNFVVNVLPKFAKSIASSKQVSGIVFLRESVLVVKGRSHFLLRAPQKKRAKLEETKEVIASYDSQDLKVVELEQEVEALKQNLEDFKDLQSEHAKYKSIIADLKQRGIINEHGDERITF